MDPFVQLARHAIVHFVQHQSALEKIPPELASALGSQRAGVFVSIHTLEGELRGCKGTLYPVQESMVEEIIHNAISACARDSRFPPVREAELGNLDIRVDVLSEMEPVADRSHLDPRRYGVLVSTEDGRRGVLLPDLEGVDSVDEQIAIACRKAGIHPLRDDYALQRFTVLRHTDAVPNT